MEQRLIIINIPNISQHAQTQKSHFQTQSHAQQVGSGQQQSGLTLPRHSPNRYHIRHADNDELTFKATP